MTGSSPRLPRAGTYTVTVSLAGFSAFKRTGVIAHHRADGSRQRGVEDERLGETVDVEAAATPLQIDSASVEGATTAKMIEALPNITQNPLPTRRCRPASSAATATSDTAA